MSKTAGTKAKLPPIDPVKQEEFEKELAWCIYQLELGLKRSDADEEQKKESNIVIAKFKSANLNVIQKRQLMRQVFGNNYKGLMQQYSMNEEEDAEKKKRQEEKKARKKEKKKLNKQAKLEQTKTETDAPVEVAPTKEEPAQN